MTLRYMSRELDDTLARAAASLELARGIRFDLEGSVAPRVPGCLWRR